MDRLDSRNLFELAIKSADNIILTAKKLESGEINPNKANALVNSYRSAGQLYLDTVKAVESSPVAVVQGRGMMDLSQVDRERLDNIASLLSDKPSRRGKRKTQKD